MFRSKPTNYTIDHVFFNKHDKAVNANRLPDLSDRTIISAIIVSDTQAKAGQLLGGRSSSAISKYLKLRETSSPLLKEAFALYMMLLNLTQKQAQADTYTDFIQWLSQTTYEEMCMSKQHLPTAENNDETSSMFSWSDNEDSMTGSIQSEDWDNNLADAKLSQNIDNPFWLDELDFYDMVDNASTELEPETPSVRI